MRKSSINQYLNLSYRQAVHSMFVVSLLFIAATFSAMVQALQVPGPLVDTDWLEQNLDQVKILDVRDDIESFTRRAVLVRKRFTGDLKISISGAHIPGAVLVDFQNIRNSREIGGRNVRRMIPEKSEFEQLMRSWGVNKNDAIIIMSQGMSNGDITMATRLYWQLKYFGHDTLAILDGGMAQWLLEEKPASIETHEPGPGNWSAGIIRENINASSDDVASAVENKTVQLVDTRELGFYLGLHKQSYVRKKG
ncbi:MAG: rhodanese-like domain-containing protein, partial [Gammaproteobacteria bacterium]